MRRLSLNRSEPAKKSGQNIPKIDDFPVSAKQQFFHVDRRLLGVPPRPVSVVFG